MGSKTSAVITLAVVASIAFLFSQPTVIAGEDTQMHHWWQKTHKDRRIEQQVEIQQFAKSQCELDLDHWNNKLAEEPNSLYFMYKKEQATKACLNR